MILNEKKYRKLYETSFIRSTLNNTNNNVYSDSGRYSYNVDTVLTGFKLILNASTEDIKHSDNKYINIYSEILPYVSESIVYLTNIGNTYLLNAEKFGPTKAFKLAGVVDPHIFI